MYTSTRLKNKNRIQRTIGGGFSSTINVQTWAQMQPGKDGGDFVLVTGASAYLGGHILARLLEGGFTVRGTVRSQRQYDRVLSFFPHEAKLDLAIIEEIESPSAPLQEAMRGATAVIHVASPVNFEPRNNAQDLLLPAINGTMAVLQVAAASPFVKRVVVTATMATMSHIGSGPIPGKVYNEADHNPVTWEKAVASSDGHYVYCGSKTLAEQAAWRFMKDEAPSFDLVTIHPSWLVGPSVYRIDKASDLNENLREFFSTLMDVKDKLPSTKVQYWVDVRDAAKSHVLALDSSRIPGGRYLVTHPAKFDWKKAFTVMHESFPEERFPRTDVDYFVESRPAVDVSKSEHYFGFGWTDLRTSVTDMATQFYQYRKLHPSG
ncbi:hypothetical protein EDD37DRAFT_628399 [Exophiala viscosa]|uniref:uncharacterized protein n=1 Tax=Exophiala viscosa TaxID=2486360 RepID=UPI00218DB8FD|nr:hypothetical protein EDD37DRAFT_628399 [Exophiala viscosa]